MSGPDSALRGPLCILSWAKVRHQWNRGGQCLGSNGTFALLMSTHKLFRLNGSSMNLGAWGWTLLCVYVAEEGGQFIFFHPLKVMLCDKARMGRWWPSRCYCTAAPIIPGCWLFWLGLKSTSGGLHLPHPCNRAFVSKKSIPSNILQSRHNC